MEHHQPTRIYVDNQRMHGSKKTPELCRQLDIRLAHKTPFHPEGKGTIEQFFQSFEEKNVRARKLTATPSLDGLEVILAQFIRDSNNTQQSS